MPALRSICNRYAYCNEDAIKNVLNYVTQSHENERLLIMLSCDLPMQVDLMEQRMLAVQSMFRSPSAIGKRIVHAVMYFSPEEQEKLAERPELLSAFCMSCSLYYHYQGYLNTISVFQSTDGAVKIHTAINAVNHLNGLKLVYSAPACDYDNCVFDQFFLSYFG